ncbi:MAG: sigma-70 family RNA polymerase sigma factor [Myxococcales bacterium]|nr:sigma-70 family RNA polymerase sigma factor [Myxococcales bacterium]
MADPHTRADPPKAAVAAPSMADPHTRVADVRKAAVAELFAAHGQAIFGYCVRQVGARALAEDVTQQVFLQAYRDFAQFRGRSSRRTWLFAIAANRCKDALRTRRRVPEADDRLQRIDERAAGVGVGPHEQLDRAQLLAALEECLQSLSLDMRATLQLRFRTELTYEQIAAQLNATPEALQMRVARAMPLLRRCLESKGWTG